MKPNTMVPAKKSLPQKLDESIAEKIKEAAIKAIQYL